MSEPHLNYLKKSEDNEESVMARHQHVDKGFCDSFCVLRDLHYLLAYSGRLEAYVAAHSWLYLLGGQITVPCY